MKTTSKNAVSKALRHLIAERDSYTCVLCDAHYSDVHHVTPRSHGGRTHPHNLVCLCRTCHMLIHREIPLTETWKIYGYENRSEWIDESEMRMIAYLCDYYAKDRQDGTYNPLDHDRFTQP